MRDEELVQTFPSILGSDSEVVVVIHRDCIASLPWALKVHEEKREGKTALYPRTKGIPLGSRV